MLALTRLQNEKRKKIYSKSIQKLEAHGCTVRVG